MIFRQNVIPKGVRSARSLQRASPGSPGRAGVARTGVGAALRDLAFVYATKTVFGAASL